MSNSTIVIKEIRLKTGPLAFQDHSRSSEPTRIDPPCTRSYSHSKETTNLSRTVSQINSDFRRKSNISHQVYLMPCSRGLLEIGYRSSGSKD